MMENDRPVFHAAGMSVLCACSVAVTAAAGAFSVQYQFVPYALFVLLAGYLLPMNWAVGCAVLAPSLCTCLLGFPEPVVSLPLTACQMIALAAFANFFYTMLKMNIYAVLLSSEAAGYVLLFCAASIYGAVSPQVIRPLEWVRQTLVTTWPGILLQAAAVPPIVLLTKRIQHRFHETRRI